MRQWSYSAGFRNTIRSQGGGNDTHDYTMAHSTSPMTAQDERHAETFAERVAVK